MSAVSGIAELEQAFKELSKGVANRIARPGLAKAGRLAVKKIKAEIPSRYKGVRKAIKSRSIKTKFNSGVAGVKVGAGVSRKRGEKSERSGEKGVDTKYATAVLSSSAKKPWPSPSLINTAFPESPRNSISTHVQKSLNPNEYLQ